MLLIETVVSAFVSKKLSALEGILATATHFMLRRYKENGVSLVDIDGEKDRREMGF